MYSYMNKIRVMIPNCRLVLPQENGKSYTVYCLQVVCDGNVTVLEKRYSEFYALYKKLSKLNYLKIIPFPPKRMLNNKEEKLVESRREGLEKYLKAVLQKVDDDVPEILSRFLGMPNYYDDQPTRYEYGDETDGEHGYQNGGQQQMNNMICFRKDAYLVPTLRDLEEEKLLPSIVMSGCLDGIYAN